MEINREFTRQRYLSLEGQSSSEYTLPDYQGDVKKILFSSAVAEDGGRYQSGDTLECVGTVVYKIIYVDSEGRITPVSFTGEYEMSHRCDGERYVDSYAHTRVANFNLRLMGPRRFSAKCALASDLFITENGEYNVPGSDVEGLECSMKPIMLSTARYLRSAEREMAEELTLLDGAILDEVEVVIHSTDVVGVACQRNEDGVVIKGQVCVRALISREGGSPELVEKLVDYQESIHADDLDESAVIAPKVSVISESIGLNPEEGGVSVVSSIIVESCATVEGNVDVKLLSDCFSTERDVIPEHGEFSYTEHACTRGISERLAFSVERETVGAESVRNVLYESVILKIEEQQLCAGGLKIIGSAHVSAVACEISEGGEAGYAPLRFEHPFVINVNLNCQTDNKIRILPNLRVECPHISLDGNRVNLEGNIAGSVSVYSDCRESCIVSIRAGEERYGSRSSLVSVYYPLGEESLFDVAKKFHVAPIKLARDNELTEAVFSAKLSPLSLSGVRSLLIK